MEHRDALKIILADPETKKEYNALEAKFAVKSALIRLRAEKGLAKAGGNTHGEEKDSPSKI